MTNSTDHGFKPGGYAIYDVEEIDIGQWVPTPDGSGPPTQVHMELKVRGMSAPFVMRFKGPETISLLIEQLTRHRDEVWPAK